MLYSGQYEFRRLGDVCEGGFITFGVNHIVDALVGDCDLRLATIWGRYLNIFSCLIPELRFLASRIQHELNQSRAWIGL